MAAASVIDDLELFGPDRSAPPPSPAEARAYCRRLARSHYENFVVAGLLLPGELRQPFYNVYAYCRWADDLADEMQNRETSLRLLDWWGHELDECYAGRPRHPVFVALAETITEFDIPKEPFRDLLTAFRQDQNTTYYATYDELLGYCRNSADPVGRLVLYLGRCYDPVRRGPLSDAVCTGLQLANFWQDVARDRLKGRTYLPQDDMARFDVADEDLGRASATPAFKRLLRFEVDRAEALLQSGLPLVDDVPRSLASDVWLFVEGGLRILEKIREQDYDVLARRPVVSKWDRARMLAGCMRRKLCGGLR